jgi:Cytochrome c7 and related cytochrome c
VGRHLTAACKSCHTTPRYRDAPSDCYACHKKEDKHRLKFGERCESCHNARAWSIWDFDHGRRSGYVLDGAHRRVACEACHVQPAPAGQKFAPVGRACVACHRKDDTHDGSFGARCEQCHVTETWKRISNGARRPATGNPP